jgi:hypothetical protein
LPQVDFAKVNLIPLYVVVLASLIVLIVIAKKRKANVSVIPDEKIVIVLEKEENHAIN